MWSTPSCSASAGVAELLWPGICTLPGVPSGLFHLLPSNIDHQMSFDESPRWTMWSRPLYSASAGVAELLWPGIRSLPGVPSGLFHLLPSNIDHQMSFDESPRWTMWSRPLYSASAGVAQLNWPGIRSLPGVLSNLRHIKPSNIDHQMS